MRRQQTFEQRAESIDSKMEAILAIADQRRMVGMDRFVESIQQTKASLERYMKSEDSAKVMDVMDGSMISYCYLSFEVPGVWASEVSLKFNFNFDASKTCGVALESTITWSSTGRDIANAMVAVSQYQNAIEFVATVEAIFNR